MIQKNIRLASVVVGFGKIGFQFDCFIVVRYCLLILTKAVFGVASGAVSFGKIWFQTD